MTDIQFYHLTQPMERILPKLLEKSLQAGMRTRVKCASEDHAEALNATLWTYTPDSFLPHGTKKDGNAEQQPIYLTAANDNPNQASLVIILDGSEMEHGASVKRAFDLVDANDAAALDKAKERQAKYQSEGHGVSCVLQTLSGGWEKLTP